MMEEIDRFQVPPVNGETQPLVRDEGRKTRPVLKKEFQMQFIDIFCFDYERYYDGRICNPHRIAYQSCGTNCD